MARPEETNSDNDADEGRFDPRKLQQELEDLVRSKFGDKVQIISQNMDFDPLADEEDGETINYAPLDLQFDYVPKDIKDYLDKFIIGQEEAKRALSIAVCDHYHHIRKDSERSEGPARHYQKQNILLLGPTGVGKTYIIKKIAELIGVPFVKADATKFTEAGYVGANVEDTIRDLVHMADGNVQLAQYGIVYIDEADKLAQARRVAGRDISGRGVQNGFLKLLEDTEIETRNPMDVLAQMSGALSGNKAPRTINTKDILFIFSGAFDGLEDIIKRRLGHSKISLANPKQSSRGRPAPDFSQVTTQDLVEFGLEPELIGRLPVKVHCHHLSQKDLFNILKFSQDSIILQYQDSFESYGIRIEFSDEALDAIAHSAFNEKTGARSLMSIIEKILRNYKFELPSSSIDFVHVDRQLVANPEKALAQLLSGLGIQQKEL